MALPKRLSTFLPDHSRLSLESTKPGPCTCTLRINTTGSPVDRHRAKKAQKRGLSWPPSGALTPVDALEAGRADARRLLRPSHLATSHDPACSPPRSLRPRWHAEQQYLSQGPHVIGQPRRHRGRGPCFFRPLRVKGLFCALAGRAAFLLRRNSMECVDRVLKTHGKC